MKQILDRRAAKKSPALFRKSLRVANDEQQPFGDLIQSWQADDFRALDAMWQRLAGFTKKSRWQRAYIERPRGHSKTTDMAMQIAWVLQNSPRPLYGMAAAADRDQAKLIRDAVERLAKQNPKLCHQLEFRQHSVLNRTIGSRLEVISSDVQSSWGALPDFVICDELCHWEKQGLWESLFSSAAKQPHCVMIVLTNAGVGRGWQWNLREAARTGAGWYFSSLDGTHAPWISDDWLEEQKRLLPEPVFSRLWLNQWQHSDGGFVSLREAETCRDENLKEQERGEPGRHYVAAIDFASKHDNTVGVLAHREGNLILVDRMDVVQPKPNEPIPVQWVEEWINRITQKFSSVQFVLDEYQLLGTIQKFEQSLDIKRFEFAGSKGNHALALTLRRLILEQEVRWYPGCGAVENDSGNNLESELASLLLKHSVTGRCRIDHLHNNHDDRAFALGVACMTLLENEQESEWIKIDEHGF